MLIDESSQGVPGTLYSTGFAGQGIILSIAMFSMAFGVLIAGGRLRELSQRHQLFTLPDYLGLRYGSNVLRLLSADHYLLSDTYMAAQVVGSGVIFNVFTGTPYWPGVVIMGAVVVAYCVIGGMRAAILSDALQGIVMVAASVLTFIAIARAGGGLSRVMADLAAISPGAMSFPGEPVGFLTWKGYVSQILMWTLFAIGQPQLVNKYMAARSYVVTGESMPFLRRRHRADVRDDLDRGDPGTRHCARGDRHAALGGAGRGEPYGAPGQNGADSSRTAWPAGGGRLSRALSDFSGSRLHHRRVPLCRWRLLAGCRAASLRTLQPG
jgi:hypothetical protein